MMSVQDLFKYANSLSLLAIMIVMSLPKYCWRYDSNQSRALGKVQYQNDRGSPASAPQTSTSVNFHTIKRNSCQGTIS